MNLKQMKDKTMVMYHNNDEIAGSSFNSGQ